ncbi:hypothetical protein [Lolliginicoccus suaedae]|uniref:hypothetical protein n=1 Tax=Lolliginicoccus suaedae TaxID=2605429 RepID=UPI0011EED5E5|nr:hypothetical protein [Lolliginicoccus suaedae]
MTATAATLRYAAVVAGSVVALAAAVLTPLGTQATPPEPPAHTHVLEPGGAIASAHPGTR